MADSFYVVPMIGTGTRENPFRGKYTRDPAITAIDCKRYSRTSVAICYIEATQTYLDFVTAQPDADFLTTLAGLNDEIGGANVNSTRSLFETLNIPGNWISANDSWREVIRGIVGEFSLSQRHEGVHGIGLYEDLEANGGGLNTQWQNLNQSFRDSLIDEANDLGIILAPSDQDQVRKVLKDFSDIFISNEIIFGGNVI